MKFTTILLFIFIFINYVSTESDIQLNTTSGLVRGKTINVLNQTLSQFLGIPFAEPPLGSLRFAKPKRIEKPIEGIIDATKTKNSCIQYSDDVLNDFIGNITISEDCLVLNIWVSDNKTVNNATKLKAVMFWLHGGGLVIGSSFQKQYNGSVLATNDIVFVSANYRLGHFGFLFGGEESAPGNMGFYDQVLALQWVRDNIHLFGGDKNQITIFGESAGSWSVSALLLSPLSKGLFRRAIMQSGANLFNKGRPILSKEEALFNAKTLAKRVNCTDDKNWLQCLKRVDANKLLAEPADSIHPIDGTQFLPLSAQNAFKDQTFNRNLDLMAGVTRDEGSTLAYYTNQQLFNKTLTENDLIQFIDEINSTYHYLNGENAVDFYLRYVNKNNSDAIKWKIYDYFGDLLIKCPTYLFAKRYAENSLNTTNVFFYELTHTARDANYEKEFGIYHGSDIDFVFGLELLNTNSTQKENIEFSKQIIKYWTDFAKYGKPDNEWSKLIDYGVKDSVTLTKELNPRKPNDYFADHFSQTCDGFWKYYY